MVLSYVGHFYKHWKQKNPYQIYPIFSQPRLFSKKQLCDAMTSIYVEIEENPQNRDFIFFSS